MGMMQVANSSFNARGLPRPALILSLLRGIIIGIPLTVVGDALWGYTGIFLAAAATSVILGIFGWLWNKRSVDEQAFRLGFTSS